MDTSKPYELMNQAWANVLIAVTEKRIDPVLVARHLNLLADGGSTNTVHALEQLIPTTEHLTNQLREIIKALDQESPIVAKEDLLNSHPGPGLGLSIRAAKCMNRLGIKTVRELISRTADDLLEAKNFGASSLGEVRRKLQECGLKLRGDED